MNRNYTIRLGGTALSIAIAFLAGFIGADMLFGDDPSGWVATLAFFTMGIWVWNAYCAYPGKPVKATDKTGEK